MNRERWLLSISILIFVGLAVYYSRLGWAPQLAKRAAPGAVSKPPPEAPVPLEAMAQGLPEVSVQGEVVDENTPWGRNPFLTEEEAKGGRDGTDGLMIKTIIVGRAKSVATIDDKTVGVGDKVDEETVVEIRPDAVILEREGRRRALKVSEPSISIKVKEANK